MPKSLAMFPTDVLESTAECLKVLGHPDRLRIVEVLEQQDLAVHEVADTCRLSPHVACAHLRLLKSHGLLSSTRNGRLVYYSISDPRLPQILACIRSNCRRDRR